MCGLNRVYLEAGTRVFCYLVKNKERQLPNKPYVGFWVGKAGNLNNLNIGGPKIFKLFKLFKFGLNLNNLNNLYNLNNLNNLNIGVDPGEGVGPGI